MNEKQILKEIAYYSKLIDNHKKTTERSQNTKNKYTYNPRNTYTTNSKDYDTAKYKYVKPEKSVISPAPERIPSTVLINPNFKQSVHINPRFTPKAVPQINSSIVHVNPKIINMNFIKNQTLIQTNLPPIVPINTVEKLAKPSFSMNNLKIIKTPNRKRRVSIRTKYKIVKSTTPAKVQTPASKTVIKDRFKIDRRSKSVRSKQKKKVFTQSINDTIRTSLFKNKTWKRSSLNKLSNDIVKTTKIKPDSVKNRRSIITLRGNKYTTGLNKKSLKLLPSTRTVLSAKKILEKGRRSKKLSFSQKSTSSTSLGSSRVRRSILNKRESSSFHKNNIPCPVYHRFGKCRRKDAGRCVFKHNPQQIALCKKFLQGACLDDNCLLSHKVSLEKMPTCKYFLEGCCVRPTCSYLHVKISPNAEICRNFLEGFCKEAVKCDKRHQYLCPDFERYGKCKRLRCRYPHKTKCVKEKPTKIIKVEEKSKEKREKIENQEPTDAKRYYVDKKKIVDSSNLVSKAPGVENNDEIYKRVKLGDLPSFIPIE